MIKVKEINNRTTEVFFTTLQDVFNMVKEIEKISETNNEIFSAWKWAVDNKASAYDDFNYYENLSDALDGLRNGWKEGTEKINVSLSKTLSTLSTGEKTTVKNYYDVCGYQASVPRYLQGIPTNMINSKKIPNRQKILTVVKHIGFRGNVKENEIIENSVKALAIVLKIENQGVRCNIDVISPCKFGDGEKLVVRIRIKNASERLNVGKLAFAVANPDMLRRIVFALRIGCRYKKMGNLSGKNYFSNFSIGGSIYDREEILKYLDKGEKYLHNFIGNIEDEIKEFNAR